MADVKWIKITTDIFDDEKILLIESLPEADSIIVIWFKLLCLAGKQNNSGVFMMNDKLAYTEEMLATIFRRNINTVRLALNTFESFGMIEKIDNVITIPNWDKHQSLEKLEKQREKTRQRVAKHRENQKKLAGIVTCAYCGNQATGVDHIIPKSKGGTEDDSNKVPCCIECNRIKNNQELTEFLNWNRDKINDELVTKNEKLSQFIELDPISNKYVTRYVPKCNADRIDKNRIDKIRLDIDKEIINKTTTTKRFKKPTVDEIKSYCEERNNTVNAEAFFDYYESKDWMIGKNRMKDWKAAVRTWERNTKKETAVVDPFDF